MSRRLDQAQLRRIAEPRPRASAILSRSFACRLAGQWEIDILVRLLIAYRSSFGPGAIAERILRHQRLARIEARLILLKEGNTP
jgi:hypothetical protein